jgi:hypothetical protein
MLGSLAVCMLACGFDASGVGSSGDIADSTAGNGVATGDGASDDAGSIEGGELDTNEDGSLTEDPGATTGVGDDETMGGSECGDWWDAQWARRREVVVGDSGIAEAHTEVPVLVVLDASRIDYGSTQIGGADLRFIGASGKLLEHEIESWNPDGNSFVWLRVPAIAPQNQVQPHIEMYYGNPAAADPKTPHAVWDADFVSVHHMRTLADSTANGHDGESPTPPSAVPGWIGGAGRFDGYDDHVKLMGESDYDLADAVTVEAWIRVQVFDKAYQAIVTKGDDAWRLHRENYTDFVGFGTDTASMMNDNLSGMTSVNDGEWHYVIAVFGGGQKKIFVDGLPDATQDYAGPLELTNHDVLIGENQQNWYRSFAGDIDEVRISSVARGRGWIAVQMRSMSDDLLDYGPEETCP